jgi:transglutaminase-like putative cysteine protease
MQSASLQFIPDGPAGTRATLQLMASVVRQYRKDLTVRNLALSIVGGLDGKHYAAEAAALTNWVRSNIRYVRDIRDVETVQTPLVTLENGGGDCDDQATLLATLLESIGFQTRFRAIKTEPGGPFVHVLAEAEIDGEWMPLETTENFPPGYFPIVTAGEMIQEV